MKRKNKEQLWQLEFAKQIDSILNQFHELFNFKIFRFFCFILLFIFLGIFGIYYNNVQTTNTLINKLNLVQVRLDSLEQTAAAHNFYFEIWRTHFFRDYDYCIPDSIYFCDQLVNINHLEAKDILNRAIGYLFDNTKDVTQALKRFHFYEKSIEDSLKKNNLHPDLKYVALAESWSYPLAVSTAGAVGINQFMKGTGYQLGIEINRDVDMRRDPWYMNQKFCEYIIWLRKHTNSATDALRAYNTGLERFLKAAATQPWVKKSWFLDINDENNIYLFWILAWKIIYENQNQFGFVINYKYPPPDLQIIPIRIDSHYSLNFMDLARLLDVNPFILKELNLAFLKINKKGERIIVPKPRGRYTTRYLKLPANINIENLQTANIPGVKFLLN